MKDPNEQVGDAEEHSVVSEDARDGQGDEEHPAHRCEHQQADTALVHVQCAGQPGVGGPGPPERGQDEHPSQEAAPGRVVREQSRHLRDREDEDQVEEELERGDLVLVELGRLARPPVRHRGETLSRRFLMT
jgi:hypothetical protein